MLTMREQTQIYLSAEPTDMRKSIDGLAALVVDVVEQKPQSGHVFIFMNRVHDKVKCLLWDRNGFVLHYKRLERGKFKLDRSVKGVLEISHDQLSWLLAGLDFLLMDEFSELNFEHY